jgi:hypothetical protein
MPNERYMLGRRVPVRVQCVDANGVPTNPDDAPTVKFFDSAGNLDRTLRLEPMRPAGSAVFGVDAFLGPDFAAGFYAWLATWAISASARAANGVFEVIPGGHEKGGYQRLEPFYPPQADYLVGETESGAIEFLKNPQV